MKIIRLENKRLGRLTVLREDGRDNEGRVMWLCKCDCGNVISVKSRNLIKGTTKSCGCIRVNDLTGKKFGRLTVVERAKNTRTKSGKSVVMYKCKCDCGNETILSAINITSGNTKSCGCYNSDLTIERNTKHGHCGERIYTIWSGMIQRCYNSNQKRYKYYGFKGITVCDEWLNDFQSFYDWAMNNGYSDNLSIDRVNVYGNYEPSNCRWATNEEQSMNRTDNHLISINGETKPLTKWSRELNITKYKILKNIRKQEESNE